MDLPPQGPAHNIHPTTSQQAGTKGSPSLLTTTRHPHLNLCARENTTITKHQAALNRMRRWGHRWNSREGQQPSPGAVDKEKRATLPHRCNPLQQKEDHPPTHTTAPTTSRSSAARGWLSLTGRIEYRDDRQMAPANTYAVPITAHDEAPSGHCGYEELKLGLRPPLSVWMPGCATREATKLIDHRTRRMTNQEQGVCQERGAPRLPERSCNTHPG